MISRLIVLLTLAKMALTDSANTTTTASGTLDFSEKTWPALCSSGVRQSPIDVNSGIVFNTTNYINISQVNYTLLNNASIHLQDNVKYYINTTGVGNIIVYKNGLKYSYNLVDVHIHLTSEHTVNGSAYEMEMHMVHLKDTAYALSANNITTDPDAVNTALVVGTFWNSSSATNNTFITNLNANKGNVTNLDFSSYSDPTRSFYHYLGSLTTPNCTEFVNWVVMSQVETMSSAQMKEIKSWVSQVYPSGNSRSVKPLNNRTVYFKAQSVSTTVKATSLAGSSNSAKFISLSYLVALAGLILLFI